MTEHERHIIAEYQRACSVADHYAHRTLTLIGLLANPCYSGSINDVLQRALRHGYRAGWAVRIAAESRLQLDIAVERGSNAEAYRDELRRANPWLVDFGAVRTQ